MLIHKLGRTLHDNLGAVDHDDQPQFYIILFQMNDDFETRWGKEITFRAHNHQGDRGHITRIPKLALWAAMLDSCTKNSTMKILTKSEQNLLGATSAGKFFPCINNNDIKQ